LELVLEFKSSDESMIKTSTTNSDYGNKTFPKIKVYLFHTPCSTMIQWYSSLPLVSRYSSRKSNPMFYSNSNGDQNYVI
jgi:hypothetical protein